MPRRRVLIDGEIVLYCGRNLHPMVPGNCWRIPGRVGAHCRECRILRQRRKRKARAERRDADRPARQVVHCREDCDRLVDSHGCFSRRLCSLHYARWRKANAKPPAPEVVIPPLPKLSGAACTGVREPLWDDEVCGENQLERVLRWERAMSYCWSCPLKKACLAARQGGSGVWGGCLFMAPSC